MRQVPIEELASTWPRVSAWIESALPYGLGDENVLDIFIALARGAYTLWVNDDLAAVTQLVRRPRQSVLTVLYVGGNSLEACRGAFAFARSECRALGIDVLRVWGRQGWEHVLGLKRIGVILQTDCSEATEHLAPVPHLLAVGGMQ
ncbi:MAG TPA: hypothetical protein VN660_01015 [Steroidobacteraceae bacterium]|nr:hypothetical protein [Steroidobacteraceae bacterium]